MRRTTISGLLCLALFGCVPDRSEGGVDDAPPAPPDGAVSSMPSPPDLSYSCGDYWNYQAMVDGVVRSPCDYDVSKILSIGGDVKTRISPPTITMEFPDGTSFAGTTDGKTFTAVRTTTFPFQDGCMWKATETLIGDIAAAPGCTLHAAYTYREAPISPPPCATPCTIDANVIINRVSIILQ